MLKLSHDKTKLKRRIPFKKTEINRGLMDQCMVYLERFPEECTHEHLATIFRRAGHVKHVSIPKYAESKVNKGFAFIEFQTPEEAQAAVDMFDNVVPQEFVNSMSDNFIAVQGAIRPLKVMRKADWF